MSGHSGGIGGLGAGVGGDRSPVGKGRPPASDTANSGNCTGAIGSGDVCYTGRARPMLQE
jgi:hypothetical protein